MKTAYILVGVPASGKSTWVEKNHNLNTFIVSTDHYIEQHAALQKKTYSDVFAEYIQIATCNMVEDVKYARNNGFDIIWDQTNTSVKARAKKLKMLPNYKKIAVVFKTPDQTELARRLANRPGKHIPESVMVSMISSFQMPTKDEGFDEVVSYDELKISDGWKQR